MLLAILSSLAIPSAIVLAFWILLQMVSWTLRAATRAAVAVSVVLGILFLVTVGEPGAMERWVDAGRRAIAGGTEAVTTLVRLGQAVIASRPVP